MHGGFFHTYFIQVFVNFVSLEFSLEWYMTMLAGDDLRQKTLGLRTSCSQCQTLRGQFCGDCLFMRLDLFVPIHIVEPKRCFCSLGLKLHYKSESDEGVCIHLLLVA